MKNSLIRLVAGFIVWFWCTLAIVASVPVNHDARKSFLESPSLRGCCSFAGISQALPTHQQPVFVLNTQQQIQGVDDMPLLCVCSWVNSFAEFLPATLSVFPDWILRYKSQLMWVQHRRKRRPPYYPKPVYQTRFVFS